MTALGPALAPRVLAFLAALLMACSGEESPSEYSDSFSPPAEPQADAPVREELRRLQESLQRESGARHVLEERVQQLSERIGEAESGEAFEPVTGTRESDAVDEATEGELAAADDLAAEDAEPDSDERPVFDVAALVSNGLPPHEAEWLRERWEQYALDKIYLDDRAAREGWRRKPRHYHQRQLLEREVREELGDEGWDRMLYASGQDNRVIVRDVLQGSAAEIAGLQPGDTILRYNGNPVYKVSALQRATTRGQVGERVRVEILRGGEVFTVDLERGPLGTMLRSSRAFPEIR
ncbi:MAG: PDZ domain-containing protein [Myxococcota bacterium]